jgi:hypothetical protein
VLQQICDYIHNYFIKNAYTGRYEIVDGTLSPLPSLKEGQRFWIVGSDLNDGVYTYRASGIMNDDDTVRAGLLAETFDGTICAMAVPPPVIAICGEINSWVEKYGGIAESPYQSETFNGYSYTKASGGASGASGGGPTWQSTFKKQLDRWRKISL